MRRPRVSLAHLPAPRENCDRGSRFGSLPHAVTTRFYRFGGPDLQDKGVRCWFAPHDMPIGAKIIDAIDEAIRLRDKVLLILSEGAIASDWVEGEVTRALDEERRRRQVVPLLRLCEQVGSKFGSSAPARCRDSTHLPRH